VNGGILSSDATLTLYPLESFGNGLCKQHGSEKEPLEWTSWWPEKIIIDTRARSYGSALFVKNIAFDRLQVGRGVLIYGGVVELLKFGYHTIVT
jgi:hypothetical protein